MPASDRKHANARDKEVEPPCLNAKRPRNSSHQGRPLAAFRIGY